MNGAPVGAVGSDSGSGVSPEAERPVYVSHAQVLRTLEQARDADPRQARFGVLIGDPWEGGAQQFFWYPTRFALEYALLGIVYYLGGWILGLGYLRYHWASATLLLPVCLVPVALIELTVSHVTSNFRLGALPEALQDPSLLVTLAVAVPVVAATAVVASRLTRSVPLR